MLWKSLTIACFLILNATAAAWSIERSPRKANTVTSTVSGMNRLEQKLNEAAAAKQYPEVERLARQILSQDPNNRTAIAYLGAALKAQSKFSQAEALYRQQIAKNNLDFPAYRQLGELLVSQGKSEAALTVYRQALTLNPANSYLDLYDINQAVFELLIRLDRQDEAIAFGKQRLAVTTNKIEILILGTRLSALFKQQGKVDESIAVLRQLIAKSPAEILLYAQLGQLLVEYDKVTEAIDLYQQAIALPSNSLSGFDRHNGLYLKLGGLLEKQQRQPEALVVYRKLIANSRAEASQMLSRPEFIQQMLAQSETTSKDTGTADGISDYFPILGAQSRINELLYQQQGWKAVATEMQPISQTTPEVAAYIFQSFGNKRIATKQYSDANLAYQQAIKLDKSRNNARLQGNLFLAWTFADRPEPAQAAYKQALALTPAAQRPKLIKNWAFTLDKAGRKPAAIALYRQFLKSPDQDRILVSLQLAQALEQSGQTTEANATYQQTQVDLTNLQRTAPQDPNYVAMQGNLFSQRQQHPAAIASYRKAIALLTKQGDKKGGKLLRFSQLKLADNLRLTANHPEAIDFYRQAIAGCDCTAIKIYQPSTLNGMAYHGLGLSLEFQGRLPDAKAAFQKALELDPSYEEAQASFKRIDRTPGK